MVESLGLTLQEAAVLGLLGLFYVLLSLFPFLWPAFISLRKSTVLTHRFKFCVLIGLLVYGVFTAISLCIGMPIDAVLTYVVPQLQYTGYIQKGWVIEVAEWVSSYGWLLMPFLMIYLTVVITRRVAGRWERLVVAWNA
jgi:hypothetical protein